jgi:hypothetical protein
MSKYITVPTVWTMYETPDDVVSIFGSSAELPPHIALEMMVAYGIAKKISTFTTTKAAEVKEDNDDGEDGPEHPVW